jgi:hypothetical protein
VPASFKILGFGSFLPSAASLRERGVFHSITDPFLKTRVFVSTRSKGLESPEELIEQQQRFPASTDRLENRIRSRMAVGMGAALFGLVLGIPSWWLPRRDLLSPSVAA